MIYLDAHATTPVLPVVFEAMEPYFCTHFGNASSEHPWGWKATGAVTKAKAQMAELLDCSPSNLFITSGATESIHWVLMGWTQAHSNGHIITSNVEHKATYGAGKWAQRLGAQWSTVPVETNGAVTLAAIKSIIKEGVPNLITLIHGNNEIGTLNPIQEICDYFATKDNVQIHLDCAQTVGKIPISFEKLGADFISFSGHKLYAPKGIGALLIKEPKSLPPLFLGGGQQSGRRAGTLNVPAIVGLGTACHWCHTNMASEAQRLTDLRDLVITQLTSMEGVNLNGDPVYRLPHNINLTFKKVSMDRLLLGLPGIGFSGSSACSSGSGEPSHVLSAIGLTPADTRSTIRFGLGHSTTLEQVQEVIEKIKGLHS